MVGEFLELGVGAADITELGGAEFGKVGLWWAVRGIEEARNGGEYVDVKFEDGVFTPSAFKTGDLSSETVLRLWALVGRMLVFVSGRLLMRVLWGRMRVWWGLILLLGWMLLVVLLLLLVVLI